jgi:transcriptional regulator GlxA family with amidase domain
MKSADPKRISKSGPLDTAVLVLDDTNMLALAAAVDPMRAANRRAGRILFRWRFATASGKPARLTAGLDVPGPALATFEKVDLVLVCASFRTSIQATHALGATLRRLASKGAIIAGIDGGPWVLARAGLLDGQSATVHWEDLEDFSTRHEKIDVRPDRVVVSGPFLTAAGAAPALEMMLGLVEELYGGALARDVGNAFLYDPPPAQPQSRRATAEIARRDPIVARALQLMEATMGEPLPVRDIARKVGLSARRLEVRFQTAIRQSPAKAYMSMRMAEAMRLAKDTPQTAASIAIAVGFSSQASFARAFKQTYGASLREVRLRFE